ncbi:TlpA disulfide reductase family protein [Algibacter sp. 2305UL17-15]|uniref:TlpA family protein disulfide reductase n=1 Tax=Algibacter sp. 2305UL17-15 TaxID=3231268 RepID=UPI003459A801
MNKLLSLLSILTILACKTEPKDYATLSGKIDNKGTISKFTVFNQASGFKKDITINEDGTFSDTLKVEAGRYTFKLGNEFGNLYLKNDTESSVAFDIDNFDETLKFTGYDANKSNFYAENVLLQKKYLSANLMSKSPEELKDVLKNLTQGYADLKEKNKDLGAEFFKSPDSDFEKLKTMYNRFLDERVGLLETLSKGSPSPVFEDYENYDGTTTSLSDLKGKYTYIDVWATWCGPCKAEIPALKRLEKAYHGKNIQFVSLSIDDDRTHGGSWDKAREDWKKMIKDKQLGGIQLFAPKGGMSQFVLDYKIQGIPRFILIDPAGNIVNPDAPRPSSPGLKDLFSELDI